jgi:hypothetical protein
MAELGLELAQGSELVQAELTLLRLTLQVLSLLLQAPPLLNIFMIRVIIIDPKSTGYMQCGKCLSHFRCFSL